MALIYERTLGYVSNPEQTKDSFINIRIIDEVNFKAGHPVFLSTTGNASFDPADSKGFYGFAIKMVYCLLPSAAPVLDQQKVVQFYDIQSITGNITVPADLAAGAVVGDTFTIENYTFEVLEIAVKTNTADNCGDSSINGMIIRKVGV
jgi:hypothetical protein